MCFTVNVNIVKEELGKRYNKEFLDPERYRPSYYYHAFSLPFIPVVTDRDIRLMQWGLIPSWVSDISQANDIRKSTFNARSESLSEKPAFSESFISRRCILPVSGFYEWQHRGSQKIPWFIFPVNDSVLSLGGIWNEWTDNESNSVLRTFSIITTEANNLLAEIHNSARRMPLVLDGKDLDKWLSGEPESVRELMRPAPEGVMAAHTIGPLIGTKATDKNKADITKPYQYYITGSLF